MNHPPFFRSTLLLLLSAMMGASNLRAQIDPETGTGWVDGYWIGPGSSLRNATFYGANLAGADLRDADLAFAHFGFFTTIEGAVFGGATLFGAVFDCHLSSVQLLGAKTYFVNIANSQHGATDGLPSGYKLFAPAGQWAHPCGIVGPGVDWDGWPLTDVSIGSFGGSTTDLRGMSFRGSALTNVDFGGGEIEGCSFHGAGLKDVSFAFAKFGSGVFYDEHTTFVGSYSLRLPDGNGGWIYSYIDPATDERWILDNDRDFIGVEEDFDDRNAELGIVGSSTNLSEKDFRGYSLADFDLRYANLTKTRLSGVDLARADLRHSVLTKADLSGANIEGSDLSNATLVGIRSGGLIGVPVALPEGWRLSAGFLIGPGANLAGKDLRSADLTGIDLTSANLTSANLSGANLSGANLDGCNLSGAILSGVRSGGILGAPIALPPGWQFQNGFLIGPGADLSIEDLRNTHLADTDLRGSDLSGANLVGVNLSGCLLDGCNLGGTSLHGANLADVRASGIVGTPASLPTSWRLKEGYLLGPGVDLSSLIIDGGEVFTGSPEEPIVLTEAKLSGLEARNTHFWFNDLDGADLRDADLNGCGFAAVSLDGALLDGLSCVNVWVVQGYPFVDLPPGWRFVAREEGLNGFFFLYDRGHLIGPGADLSGADLSSLDLSSASLAGTSFATANLDATNLSGANLTHADLSTATGLDTTVFTGATLDGILLPPGYSVVGNEVVGGNRPDPVSSFRAWARAKGLPDAVNENTRSSRGHPLLLHFAYGVDPDRPIPAKRMPHLQGDGSGGPTFRFAVPKAASGVTITPEFSASLGGAWSDMTAQAEWVEEDETDTYYEVAPPSDSNTGFFRVHLVQ